MPMVNGYSKAYLTVKENATFTDAAVVGDDLVLYRKDGSSKNVGAIRGDKGPDGPNGELTQQILDDAQSGLLYTPWTALNLHADFGPLSSGNFGPPEYRYNSYYLELRGLVQYTAATTISSGIPVIASGLPVNPIKRHIAIGSLMSRDVADIRIIDSAIRIQITGNVDPLQTNNWIALNNIRVPLD